MVPAPGIEGAFSKRASTEPQANTGSAYPQTYPAASAVMVGLRRLVGSNRGLELVLVCYPCDDSA